MEIEYSPKFMRQFKKLPKEAKESALKCEKLFRKDPFDPKLKTHKLHGVLREYWAFSIFYDCRICFAFMESNFVRFHTIGNHDIYN